jgi:hypothetical protein
MKMTKCSPVESRKNLEVATMYVKYGIDFVAVPVRDEEHKSKLLTEADKVLQEAIDSN